VASYTAVLAQGLRQLGWTLRHETAFDTVTVQTGGKTDPVLVDAIGRGMNLRRAAPDAVGITLDETSTRDDVIALWQVFAEVTAQGQALPSFEAFEKGVAPLLPESLRRSRCSTPTTPKPKCCATCACCRTRTSRSTAR
jgi:glycine dehydrogenase